jgi:hypothetical protein
MRKRVGNRERQRRWARRQRLWGRAVANAGLPAVARRPVGVVRVEDFPAAIDRLLEDRFNALPPPPTPRLHNGSTPRQSKKPKKPLPRFCTRCEERPLNLGRYKTAGDICGTCKKELKAEARQKQSGGGAEYIESPEELRRQLADETPLPDDDDEEAWAKLLGQKG